MSHGRIISLSSVAMLIALCGCQPRDLSPEPPSPPGGHVSLARFAGESVEAWPVPGAHVTDVAIGRDGMVIAGRTDGCVSLYPNADPRELRVVPACAEAVTRVALTADGSTLAAGTEAGRLVFFGVPTWQRRRAVLAHDSGISVLCAVGRGEVIASGDQNGVLKLWNARLGTLLETRRVVEQGAVQAVAASPDGAILATAGADGALRTWDAAGKPAGAATANVLGAPVTALAFSQDGEMIAAGTESGRILWFAARNPAMPVKVADGAPDRMPVADLDFCDERVVLACYPNGLIRLSGIDGDEDEWSPFRGESRSIQAVAIASRRGKNARQGVFEETGGMLDLAVSGNGYLQFSSPHRAGGMTYARSGSLFVNEDGVLVLGSPIGPPLEPAIQIPLDWVNVCILSDGSVMVKCAGDDVYESIGSIELATFANPAGLKCIGHDRCVPTDASGKANPGSPGEEGRGLILQGVREIVFLVVLGG